MCYADVSPGYIPRHRKKAMSLQLEYSRDPEDRGYESFAEYIIRDFKLKFPYAGLWVINDIIFCFIIKTSKKNGNEWRMKSKETRLQWIYYYTELSRIIMKDSVIAVPLPIIELGVATTEELKL